MDLDKLTLGEVKALKAMLGGGCDCAPSTTHPFEIGANYLIRTVTMIQTGRLVSVCPTELVIEDAAWIADTGRFTNALSTGNFGEVEMFPPGKVIIGRTAIIDACKIGALPSAQK